MNKYIVILLLLALYACSEKSAKKIVSNYKVDFKSYAEDRKETMTEVTDVDVKKIINADTVTFIYFGQNKNAIYNDTLKMYKGLCWFNGLKKKPLDIKSLAFGEGRVKVLKIDYPDTRAGLCYVLDHLYVNDSLGIIMKRKMSYGGTSVVECGANLKGLQHQIKKDSIFFKF